MHGPLWVSLHPPPATMPAGHAVPSPYRPAWLVVKRAWVFPATEPRSMNVPCGAAVVHSRKPDGLATPVPGTLRSGPIPAPDRHRYSERCQAQPEHALEEVHDRAGAPGQVIVDHAASLLPSHSVLKVGTRTPDLPNRQKFSSGTGIYLYRQPDPWSGGHELKFQTVKEIIQ